MPHRAVVRETAQMTKVNIVYYVSTRVSLDCASLNDSLDTSPSWQNMIWDILARSRFRLILLSVNIEKPFLQLQIMEAERDELHFHWVKHVDSKEMETLRFARLVFILVQLSFVLETCSASINILTTTGTSILKQLTLLKLICTSLIWLQGQ